MTAIITGLFSRVWLYVVGALAAIAALVGLYASIRKGGRDSQRADDALAVEKRTRMATQARIEASKPVTKEAESADPFNRDAR